MIQMLDDIDMVTKAYGIFFKKIGQWNDKQNHGSSAQQTQDVTLSK